MPSPSLPVTLHPGCGSQPRKKRDAPASRYSIRGNTTIKLSPSCLFGDSDASQTRYGAWRRFSCFMKLKLKRMPGRPVQAPDTLCHFTTISGLLGIIESNSIWASNVSFLNDKKELKHGIDAASNVIKRHPFMRDKQELLQSVLNELKTYKLPDTYAACFCKSNDLLSQWRGYGGRQQGVCITFHGESLRQSLKDYKIRAMEVIYDKERTKSRLKQQIDKVLNEEFKELIGEKSDSEIRDDIIRAVARLAPRFKDDGFAEEDEWRFVIQRSGDLSGVSFRENSGSLVPFIVMKSSEKLPIKEITVGPGNHQEMASNGIKMLLDKHGYQNVMMNFSEVPFRT